MVLSFSSEKSSSTDGYYGGSYEYYWVDHVEEDMTRDEVKKENTKSVSKTIPGRS